MKQSTYRFAFYGRSGSGKTCLLSALAMSHRPHPDGYTSTRVPLQGAKKDAKQPQTKDEEPAELSSRERGDQWIEEAVESLQKGELPRANQASDFVMTFQYEFTSPDRRTYRIELVDYSGELLNPRDLSDSESLAAQLREHLLEMDGLLVVAEAPRSGETEHLSNELNLLRQAFVSLRGEKQDGPALDAPVALLVSKWDRQADLGGDPQPDEQLQKLDEFFESPQHGEYRQLRNDLQNGVTPGNFRAFPVSALGPVVQEQREDGRIVERPAAQAPLPSFGMEDGFVWAARRCDALALRDCEERALGLSWHWPPWSAGSGRLASTAARLARRFPRESTEKSRAQRVARTCRAKQLSRGLLTVGTLLCLLLGGEAWWDREAFRQGEAALTDPTTDSAVIQQHEQWLESYAGSGGHRHFLAKFFVSADEAYERVHSLRKQRVDADWSRVWEVPDVLARAAAAQQHVASYPNTLHLDEARRTIEQAQLLKESRENAAWWTLVASDSERALQERNQPRLTELLARIDQPPFPDRETEEEHARRTDLRLEVSTLLSELAAEKEWAGFLEEYTEHVSAGRHLDAGSMLAKRLQERTPDERLAETCSQFRTHLANELPQALKELIRLNKWPDARELVSRMEREIGQWPTDLQPPGRDEFIAHQRRHVDRSYDQHLYDVLRRNRTSSAAQDYLDVAPIGAMRRTVQDFKQWLAARGEAMKLTLVLTRVEWGSGAQDANDNHITVRLNEKTVGEKTKVRSKPHTSTGEIMRHSFQAKLDDDVKIAVGIKERDFFGYHDDHGRGERSVRVYDLIRGFSLPLRSSKYYQEAIFHVEGAPPEPKLPDWRDD